jgi:hypothetical protein
LWRREKEVIFWRIMKMASDKVYGHARGEIVFSICVEDIAHVAEEEGIKLSKEKMRLIIDMFYMVGGNTFSWRDGTQSIIEEALAE